MTGADSTHAKSLLNLLDGVADKEPENRVIVYDLGLSTNERFGIVERHQKLEIRTFDFSLYPDYFNIRIHAGEYAWKATIVEEAARDTNGLQCWKDAGNIITQRLVFLRRKATKFGYYTPQSKGTVSKWTHEGMLAFFGLPKGWNANIRNRNGACIIFDLGNARGQTILKDWAKYSAQKECIAPCRSSRANYRQDQSLLTVLSPMSGPPPKLRYWEFAMHQDLDWS